MLGLELKNFHLKYESSGFEIGPDFNLSIDKGDFLGLVGESGCGKSSIGKVLIGLINHEEKDNFGVSSLNGELSFKHMDNQINYLDTSGRRSLINAKRVYLAAGAVNTSRIILNSLSPELKHLNLQTRGGYVVPSFSFSKIKSQWPNTNTFPSIFISCES